MSCEFSLLLHSRVDPDTVARQRVSSVILLAWARNSVQMSEVLPLFCRHGLSSGDFTAALDLPRLGGGVLVVDDHPTDRACQKPPRSVAGNCRTDNVYSRVDGMAR